MTRRQLLAATLAASPAASARPPRILLRGSWQSVNIGDVGHTPGALALLRKYCPQAEITLWPGELGHGARELLQRAFPEVKIVEGRLARDGKPETPALAQAWAGTDLYLSGTGSNFPGREHAAAFLRATGKPLGVFGVTIDPISGIGEGRDPEGGTLDELRARVRKLPADHLPADIRYVLDRAAFFFCRDTITLEYLRRQRAKTPVLDFGPDSQLGMDLRNDAKANAWLREHGLERGKFLCAVPRLRYTPYYRVHNRPRGAGDEVRDAINARTVESDHARLRDLMAAYIRATGERVLVCAEMTYQVELGKEILVDPLPAEVKKNVIWRDTFWLPDEAASVYSQARAVVSLECHSPLIALGVGTPAFYLRQPTDTVKGQMYRDFGAGEWMFEIEETGGAQLWSRLETIVRDPAAARRKVREILDTVGQRQRRMGEAVRKAAAPA